MNTVTPAERARTALHLRELDEQLLPRLRDMTRSTLDQLVRLQEQYQQAVELRESLTTASGEPRVPAKPWPGEVRAALAAAQRAVELWG